MKKDSEIWGLAMGIASIALFWVPPIGLTLGIAAIIVSSVRRKPGRRFSSAGIVVGALGIASFAAFWGTVWALSQ